MNVNSVLEACVIGCVALAAAVLSPSAQAQNNNSAAIQLQQQQNYQNEINRRMENQRRLVESYQSHGNQYQPYTPIQQSEVPAPMLSSSQQELLQRLIEAMNQPLPTR